MIAMNQNLGDLSNFYEGKNILVSGGAGSIGKWLVRRLIEFKPKVIRILDNNENGLFEAQQEFQKYGNIRFLLGDVRDKDRIKIALSEIDVVFHAAALKHVPICEFNPFEAVKTNVLGTQNMIDASLLENVEKFALISTDKAVNPVNTMGATKLLCEKLTIDACSYKGNKRTLLSCVRFGNVLDTRGSVLQSFRKQIEKGAPITVTSSKMRRFMISPLQAIEFVLKATMISRGGEIFILKMPALKIIDLAQVMIDELAPQYGYDAKTYEIKIIGKRLGERFHEELMTPDEAENTFDLVDMYAILSSRNKEESSIFYSKYNHAKISRLTTRDTILLSKEEVNELVRNYI